MKIKNFIEVRPYVLDINNCLIDKKQMLNVNSIVTFCSIIDNDENNRPNCKIVCRECGTLLVVDSYEDIVKAIAECQMGNVLNETNFNSIN